MNAILIGMKLLVMVASMERRINLKRALQSHPTIDTMEGSACCLLCGTLEDPFVGCEHRADMLFRSMEESITELRKVHVDELD
jgi:hypothetical protein